MKLYKKNYNMKRRHSYVKKTKNIKVTENPRDGKVLFCKNNNLVQKIYI